MSSAKVTISKHSSIDSSHVSIEIMDAASGAKVSAFLELEDFAQAILGLGRVDAETEVRDIQFWGHTRTAEKRTLSVGLLPGVSDASVGSQWFWERFLRENVQVEPNQVLDSYLGAKNAIRRVGDSIQIEYRVLTYTPPTEEV